ncbi:retinoblastoma-like protein 1-like protein [Sarcoptes scabiei]|uniref:Retinoblastoma-like protein 1-like protein n=1 Tax=Sarcoptes scabiei TaxID=52283 RepID=A0A132AJJ2_SARSC|nr:retinoblastoma-like protein 1-like protein [Sarcoptes scabiei]
MDMDSSDNEEIYDKLYTDIRASLNIDNETLDDAWDSYRRINNHFALEGSKLDWLACSLYVSCRKCVTPTKGQGKIEGNLVSLTRILRSCNISLMKFFKKIKSWIEMAHLPAEMQKKIDQIQTNFSVTCCIFQKYKPLFEDVFKCPTPPSRFSPKNRKVYQPLNSLDVFTFCWTLFVYIKSRYSQIGDDLVNSYHLLVVCVDYCFTSVLSFDNYRDIINSEFYDELSKELKCDVRTYNYDNRVSIIDVICRKHKGIALEIKHIRKHWFKSHLKKLIDRNDLRKRTNGIMDHDVIDFNYKFLKKEYGEFVLTIGDFDEYVFLNDTAVEELGATGIQSDEIDKKLLEKIAKETSTNLIPSTPLSSIQYLTTHTPANHQMTPISSATSCISRLQSILLHYSNKPGKELEKMLNSCGGDLKARIKKIVDNMGEIFVKAYSQNGNNQSVIKSTLEYRCVLTSGDDFASKRKEFAETFFYHTLENIIKSELRHRIQESQASQFLSKLASNEIIIRSFFACSLEIVLFSYNLCNRIFPWILEIFDNHSDLKIAPFYFYKVIEPIIREEQSLPRVVVKHLGKVEEQILESLAWKSDSPVWSLLSKSLPPNCKEVSLDIVLNQQERRQEPLTPASIFMSPAFRNDSSHISFGMNLPKGNVSVIKGTKSLILTAVDIPSGSLIPTVDNNTARVAVKEETNENQMSKVISPLTPMKNPQSSSQINLFYRKVYTLASTRLRDLLNRLKINSDEIKLKIWTCIEHVLQHHAYLMCDHHLDQIIMCSIYSIAKINIKGDRNIQFQEIIEVYRLQPQSSNMVYRNVKMASNRHILNQNENMSVERQSSANSSAPIPTGTIIDFYNKIFLPSVTQDYILKFSPSEKNPDIKLSPMPRNKFSSPNIHSPLRCMPNYPIYVSPLRKTSYISPIKSISYRFQHNFDTSKDLEHINSIMRMNSNHNNTNNTINNLNHNANKNNANNAIINSDLHTGSINITPIAAIVSNE